MSLMKPIRNWSICCKSRYNIDIISFLNVCSEFIWNLLDFRFSLKPFFFLRVGDGQGGLACYSLWGRRKSDMTERLNWTELNRVKSYIFSLEVNFIGHWVNGASVWERVPSTGWSKPEPIVSGYLFIVDVFKIRRLHYWVQENHC